MQVDMQTVAPLQNTSRSPREETLHNLRRTLCRRIAEYARKRVTDEAPGVMDVDVSFFLDPEMFAREHQKLFRETPVVACLSTDIAEPGSAARVSSAMNAARRAGSAAASTAGPSIRPARPWESPTSGSFAARSKTASTLCLVRRASGMGSSS